MDKETKAIEEAKSRGKIFIENGWTEHEVEIFVKGFVEGSDWSIETAYHQPGDIPFSGEMILCETKGFPMIAGPNHENFNETVEHFGITRWAYTNDLLPGVVPSPEKKEVNPKFRKGDLVVLKSYQKCIELNKDWQLNEAALKGLMTRKFKIEDIEIENGQVFYKLDGGTSVINRFPECFLDYVGNLLQVPKMNAVNPKYSTGQSVIIKSEGELRLLYGKDADLTDLIPYVNQEARIEDVIVTGDTITYMIRRYMMKGITVREDAIKEPVPEYKKGQSVVIKSESDLHEIYYGNSILTYLLPFAGKVVQIIETTPSRDPAYTFYRIENEESNITLDVTYNAILCDANNRPQREPLECRNEIDSITVRDIHVAQLDTSKFNPSPMETWKALFASVESFLSVASPDIRAWAAGQLYGYSECLMQQITETPIEAPDTVKEDFNATILVCLADDVLECPNECEGKEFATGTFKLKDGAYFSKYRIKSSCVVYTSKNIGVGSSNHKSGLFSLGFTIRQEGFTEEDLKDFLFKFKGRRVVLLYKEDDKTYYSCIYTNDITSSYVNFLLDESGLKYVSLIAERVFALEIRLKEEDLNLSELLKD